MSKIIIDITRLFRRTHKRQMLTGIDRVSLAYVKHYQISSKALLRICGRNFVLSNKNSQKLFTWLLNPQTKLNLPSLIISSILQKNIQKNSVLLNTGHIGIKQKNYFRMLNQHSLKPVFFIHDLIPITYPEYCSPGENMRLKDKLDYILEYAQGIITNSQATLDEVNSYAKTKLPATVAKLATDIKVANNLPRPIKKPYFVMLSTIEARKNHLLILQIFRKLAKIDLENCPHLFIIGKRGWEAEQVFDLLDRSQILKKVITEIKNCQDAELINFIRHSQALLFPSFAEGYGLPLIEALALDTPVIASNLAVFKEIAADIPEYIDPLDATTWQAKIQEYTNPASPLRAQQKAKITSFKAPSWQEHFKIIDNFLENI